jgi:hypothetical protein
MNMLDQFVLLCHHREKDWFIPIDNYFTIGMSGIILNELFAMGILSLSDNKVILIQNAKTNHPVYERVVEMIATSEKKRSIREWISRIHFRYRNMKREVLIATTERGYLRMNRKKFMNLIPYRSWSLANPVDRVRIETKLREGLFQFRQMTQESYSLLGIIHAMRYYMLISGSFRERRDMRRRVKEMIKRSKDLTGLSEGFTDYQLQLIKAVSFSIGAYSRH